MNQKTKPGGADDAPGPKNSTRQQHSGTGSKAQRGDETGLPLKLTNADFLRAVAADDNGVFWCTAFKRDPKGKRKDDAWTGQACTAAEADALPAEHNTYFATALFRPGALRRAQGNAKRVMVIVVDDPKGCVLPPTYKLETSPGNYQHGFALRNGYELPRIKRLLQKLTEAKHIGADPSGNNTVRYGRLPIGTNTKHGGAFRHVLRSWHPELRYTLEELEREFGGEPEPADAWDGHVAGKPEHGIAEHVATILQAKDGRHDAMVRLTYALAQHGLAESANLSLIRGLFENSAAASDEKTQVHIADAPRTVHGAYTQRVDETREHGGTLAELRSVDLPPLIEYVKNMAPAGVLLLQARPKIGKSLMALEMTLCFAARDPRIFLGQPTEHGQRVLYLALEDGRRMVRRRTDAIATRMVFGGYADDAQHATYTEIVDAGRVHFEYDVPPMDRGGEALLDAHMAKYPDTRVVVVDTWARFRPVDVRGSGAYDVDYRAMAQLHKWQRRHPDALLVVVHHTRKFGKAEEGVEAVNGTMGLTAVPDTIWTMSRSAREPLPGMNSKLIDLNITGRDVTSADWVVSLEKHGWVNHGPAEELVTGTLLHGITNSLLEAPDGLDRNALAQTFHTKPDAMSRYLNELKRRGVAIQLTRGVWTHREHDLLG